MLGKICVRFLAFLVLLLQHGLICESQADIGNFVKTNGVYFMKNGKTMYLNGFNAYWLMMMASDPSARTKVSTTFQQASKYGMNVARTWAFNDGGYNSLQSSPGVYNENMFKGLDFVIAEAKKYGIHLILGLVNNFKDLGGKAQYVQWAKEHGQQVTDENDFYINALVKQYYKNHIKTVLTRINTIARVAYKDDPTIFAWELINEPRCTTDSSGKQIQSWVEEIAAYLKSIDQNHLLDIGLEGFYGNSVPSRKQYNPNTAIVGTDFISNNLVKHIDFATIHIYPEGWLPYPTEAAQAAFVDKWIQSHIQDSTSVLKKPLVIGEFGKSWKFPGYTLQKRDAYYGKVYNAIYTSSKSGGPLVGGLFWQLLAQGMESWGDGYQVVLQKSPTTAGVIGLQSRRLWSLSH
ncbi:mannan endo-1,4-beta-mannosidase 4-like [Tripterygium wilfordii]|uniref:mannan endo-1,4-beta-mannosidase 4-like n=1 Tax=Tripterygium wilfordii TaxID=458696 RepID=UPI0018F838CE|nr:mannan endo-1,4-beta-mannosidase 4-like [Tripterygium wilfordii]